MWIATAINKMADLSSRRHKNDGSIDVQALAIEEFEILNNALSILAGKKFSVMR